MKSLARFGCSVVLVPSRFGLVEVWCIDRGGSQKVRFGTVQVLCGAL